MNGKQRYKQNHEKSGFFFDYYLLVLFWLCSIGSPDQYRVENKMLSPTEWRDNEEVFEAVASALEQMDGGFTAVSRDEPDCYGGMGYVQITAPDGTRYQLALYRES